MINTAVNSSRRRLIGGALAVAALSIAPLAITGCDSSWVATAQKDIDPAISIIESIGGIVLTASGQGAIAAAALPIINAGVSAAHAALVEVKTVIDAYNASPSTTVIGRLDDAITAALASFSDLSQKLSSLVPANVLQIITTGAGIIISVLSSLQLVIPASAKSLAASPGRATAANLLISKKAAPPSPEQMLYGYNSVVVLNGFAPQQAK